ncbi:hypothetical protein [Robertkochia solimangrovi]|uniref:hypothetical protein n=1 Tax=Robertkochia solimangrovi TaxID=2213046 RepID=UPI00117F5182|nr:hypothetical protein [Robertkochia solimangrovi]TRZ43948.1 hypothetical protein DMZ48_08290 [Robertkochia solimangrovi]
MDIQLNTSYKDNMDLLLQMVYETELNYDEMAGYTDNRELLDFLGKRANQCNEFAREIQCVYGYKGDDFEPESFYSFQDLVFSRGLVVSDDELLLTAVLQWEALLQDVYKEVMMLNRLPDDVYDILENQLNQIAFEKSKIEVDSYSAA